MEQINPYAVMRNTATYEAFKTYNRRAAGAGQPFLLVGFSAIISPQFFFLASRWLHRSPVHGTWIFAALASSVLLGAALIGVGVRRTVRFRRDNPIPDEWRQVPRSIRSPVPARTPRPHARG